MNINEAVEEYINQSPFIEEALVDKLINVSSLARQIKNYIEKKTGKTVQEGAVLMAIKRRPPNYYYKVNIGIKNFMKKLGDITVRSDLIDFTFENSDKLVKCQALLMNELSIEKEIFTSLSKGIYETTLIISKSKEELVEQTFKDEKLISKKSNLSSITIKLPADNTEISGIYYFILMKLAWAGVNIFELISTTNEFTIIVSDNLVNKAFEILLALKK